MKSRVALLLSIFLLWLVVFGSPPPALADKLALKDGTEIEGVIRKIEKGQVTVEVAGETKVFDILGITSMEFDTPHLPTGTSRLPLEHFLANMEAQEMVSHILAVEKSAAELRKLIDQTKTEWGNRKTIDSRDLRQWETAKDQFRRPLSRYQEVLNDFYFHVLGKVDEYNKLTKEADAIYVGVKGPFKVGSSLIPSDMRKLPLKKYVPSNWYDTIFYEGYNRGYNEAYEKYSANPYAPRAGVNPEP